MTSSPLAAGAISHGRAPAESTPLDPPTPTAGSYRLLAVYAATAFWAASLVFVVQPMLAKMVLPSLGGAPSVWLVSLLFFQVALLVGYAYAHVSVRYLGPSSQIRAHLGLLALGLVALPIALPSGWAPPPSSPVPWLLGVLTVTVAGPYVAAVATGPLLHRWYAGTRGHRSQDPFVLFAASNAGSLVGLLAYPVLIEPRMSLSRQAWAWAVGYLVLIGLCLLASRWVVRTPRDRAPKSPPPIVSLGERLRWCGYAAAPAALLMGVTHHLTTDVAAVPLLWVVPLALYLITFVVAFAPRRRGPLRAASVACALLAGALALVVHREIDLPTWGSFALHLSLLLAGATVAHVRLARTRPVAQQATGFLLWVAAGGAVGGLSVAVLAPVLFVAPLEYPLAVVAVLLSRPRGWLGRHRPVSIAGMLLLGGVAWWAVAYLLPMAEQVPGTTAVLAAGFAATGAAIAARVVAARPMIYAALVAALLLPASLPQSPALLRERTFYGEHTVREDARGHHRLVHGTTTHGTQDPQRPDQPIGYYHPSGPIGQLFVQLNGDGRLRQVSVAGLGAGTLAAYARPGQHFTFYEIDPTVVDIATNPDLFTYLRDTGAEVDITVTDARLGIEAAPTGSSDLIVLDAFTSNAVPVHLLTIEAIEQYLRVLRDDGLLLINISNRYIDLEPVLAAAADHLDLVATVLHDDGEHPDATPARWILLADDHRSLPDLRGAQPAVHHDRQPWTDDNSAIWRAIYWR